MASIYRASYTKAGPNGTRIKLICKNWTIEYTDAHGVRRKVRGGADKKAAAQLAAQLEKDAALGRVGLVDPFRDSKATALEEHLSAYDSYQLHHGHAARHRRQVQSRLRLLFSTIPARYLPEITVAGVERLLAALQESGRNARTRNSYLASAKAFLEWCVTTERLPSNPLARLKPAREGLDPRHERRALTSDEVARLIRAAAERPVAARLAQTCRVATDGQVSAARIEGAKTALIYRVLFETGLRVGELKALVWGDLDLRGPVDAPGCIHVGRSIAKNRKASSIPIRPGLKAELVAWRDLTGLRSSKDRVFRLPWRPAERLRRDLAYAGIPYRDERGRHADLHALRHSLASHLAASGVAPRAAQDLLRHSTIELTLNTYTDPALVDRKLALDTLPTLPSILAPSGQGGSVSIPAARPEDAEKGIELGAASRESQPEP